MKVASTKAECIAWEARIVAGNHNNSMLIDRVVEKASFELSWVRIEAYAKIWDARKQLRKAADDGNA